MISESQYENSIIEKIKNLGYKFLNSEETSKKIGYKNSEVIIEEFLEDSLRKINKKISQKAINEIVYKIKNLTSSEKIEANKKFQKYLVEGIKIYDEKEKRTITYKIIDTKTIENNDFVITNQISFDSSNPMHKIQRPDIIIFLNGLPIVVMELKRLEENDNLEEAYRQISNYENYINNLFVYNCLNVIANISSVKFGALNSSFSRYKVWRGKKFSEEKQSVLFTDLFKKNTLLDVITNYSFYDSTEESSKIIASYHQYYGVKSSIKSISKAFEEREEGKNGQAGIFWHTQGSGKSFSMLFLVKQISQIRGKTTFLIVTDRNDLDNQLYSTFEKSKEYIGQKIHQIRSIKDLKENLKDKKQNGVFFTTIQKFSKDVEELSSRDDVLIISDEAHRSHNNIEVSWEFEEKDKNIKEKIGQARYLREAFPNATYIGFTGTPIETEATSTSKIFGDVITKYLMSDAERDKVVVPIRYENNKPKMVLNYKELQKLTEEREKIVKELEQKSNFISEVEKKINKEMQKIKLIIQDPDRIEGVTKDFIKHYESRSKILKGKAMFVALNRDIAYKYYKKIIELRPEWKNKVKLIITGNGRSDSKEMIELIRDSNYRREMAAEFKKDESEFKIAIVVDMWLTGFDVPSLDALYLDKPIKMHNLMQAIARTNRIYENKEVKKEYGLVIDYIGLWTKLEEALSFYSGTSKAQVKKTRNLESLKTIYSNDLKNIFKKFDLDKFWNKDFLKEENYMIDFIEKSSNEILKNKKQEEFINFTKNLQKNFKEIINSIEKEESIKFSLTIGVRGFLLSSEFNKINFSKYLNKISKQTEKVLEFAGMKIINSFEGDPIVISDIIKFLDQEVREGYEELDIKNKTSGIRNLLLEAQKVNYRKSLDLENKLNDLINRYDKNFINQEELIEHLKVLNVDLKEEIENAEKRENDGYSKKEIAFLDIIEKPTKLLKQFDKAKIKLILKDLLIIINNDKNINKSWVYNDSKKRSVRLEIKKLLHKYDFPPEEAKITSEEVVEQIVITNGLNQ